MEHIDYVVYINLDHRTDRREQLESDLRRIGIPSEKVHRLSATMNPSNRGAGCMHSHARGLEMAYQSGAKNVLMLEDDARFINSVETVQSSLSRFFEKQGENWRAVLLTVDHAVSSEATDELYHKISESHNGCAYIVNRPMMEPLFRLFFDSVEPLQRTGAHWIYTNDVVWKKFMREGGWYAFRSELVYQSGGFSDISGNQVPPYHSCWNN